MAAFLQLSAMDDGQTEGVFITSDYDVIKASEAPEITEGVQAPDYIAYFLGEAEQERKKWGFTHPEILDVVKNGRSSHWNTHTPGSGFVLCSKPNERTGIMLHVITEKNKKFVFNIPDQDLVTKNQSR